MGRELLLGVDLGTTSVKAVLVDEGGALAGLGRVATPWAQAEDGRVEAPVDDMLAAVPRAVRQAVGSRGGAQVAAVGVAGMAESGAVYGRDGRPATPVVAWNDPRGDAAVARLGEVFGAEYDRWIGQRARRVLSVAKLAWFVERGVVAHRWLGAPELVLWRLTGVAATEHSLAARTGCYDVAERRWRPEVAEALKLPGGLFPPVLAAGSVMGRTSRDGAAWLGVTEGVAVTIGGHDHLAGAIGAGAGERDLVNSVGTAETVAGRFAALPDLDVALGRRVAVSVAPGGVGWAGLAGAARAGVVLRAAAGALSAPPDQPDRLDRLAGPPVDVGDWIDDPSADLPEGDPGAVWAGVLHALSRRAADAVERIRALQPEWDRMVVIGGGGRSEPWLRAKAAITPVPVWRSAAVEAAARGAAACAGAATGWWPSPGAAPAPPMARVDG